MLLILPSVIKKYILHDEVVIKTTYIHVYTTDISLRILFNIYMDVFHLHSRIKYN